MRRRSLAISAVPARGERRLAFGCWPCGADGARAAARGPGRGGPRSARAAMAVRRARASARRRASEKEEVTGGSSEERWWREHREHEGRKVLVNLHLVLSPIP